MIDNLKFCLVFSALIKRKGVVNNDASVDITNNNDWGPFQIKSSKGLGAMFSIVIGKCFLIM